MIGDPRTEKLKRTLQEIAAKLPELQRLVEESSEYIILPPGVGVTLDALGDIGEVFSNEASRLRILLLSQTEGELPPPSEEFHATWLPGAQIPPDDRPSGEWPPEGPGMGSGPLFPPPPEIGGAGMGARRTPPPLPRSPGGERLPDEAREPARNP